MKDMADIKERFRPLLNDDQFNGFAGSSSPSQWTSMSNCAWCCTGVTSPPMARSSLTQRLIRKRLENKGLVQRAMLIILSADQENAVSDSPLRNSEDSSPRCGICFHVPVPRLLAVELYAQETDKRKPLRFQHRPEVCTPSEVGRYPSRSASSCELWSGEFIRYHEPASSPSERENLSLFWGGQYSLQAGDITSIARCRSWHSSNLI